MCNVPSSPGLIELYLCDEVCVRFVTSLLILPQCNRQYFILAHKKFRISEGLPKSFEIISRHVLKRKHIDVLKPTNEVMNFINNKFFMLSSFRLHLC